MSSILNRSEGRHCAPGPDARRRGITEGFFEPFPLVLLLVVYARSTRRCVRNSGDVRFGTPWRRTEVTDDQAKTEQHDEWAIARRYMSLDSLAQTRIRLIEPDQLEEVTPALETATG